MEETRRGIDPFNTQHKRNFNKDVLEKGNNELPAFNDRKIPTNTMYSTHKPWADHYPLIFDHDEGPIQQVHDAMVATHNVRRDFKNREVKRESHHGSPECRGVKTLRSEYLGKVLNIDGSRTHGESSSIPETI